MKIGDKVWYIVEIKDGYIAILCTISNAKKHSEGGTLFYDIDEPIGHDVIRDNLFKRSTDVMRTLLKFAIEDILYEANYSALESITFNDVSLNDWREKNIKGLMSHWDDDIKKEFGDKFPIEYKEKPVREKYFSVRYAYLREGK